MADKQLGIDITATDSTAPAFASVKRSMTEVNRATGQVSAAMDRVSGSTRMTSYQMQQLKPQINDVVTSLMAGMPPMQVLAQQGGQIYQVFGSVGAMLQAIPGWAFPAAMAVGVLGAAYMAMGSNTTAAEEALQRYEDAMKASNGVLLTANELSAAAARAKIEEAKALNAAALAQERETMAALMKARILIDRDIRDRMGNAGFDPATAFRDPLARIAKEFDAAQTRIDALLDARDKLLNPEQTGAARGAREDAAGRIFEGTRTAFERYKAGLAEAEKLLKTGAISQDTFNRRVEQLGDEYEAATRKAVPAVKAQVDAFYQLRMAIDPAFAAEQRFAEQTRAVTDALIEGRISIQEAERYRRQIAEAAWLATDAGRAESAAVSETMRLYEQSITPAERYAQALQAIEVAREAGRISGYQADRAREQAVENLEGASKRTDDIARDLGMTFNSAFEDAIIRGEKLRNVLGGIAQDIARIILRQTVTKPIAGVISGFIGSAVDSIMGNISFGGGTAAKGPNELGLPGFGGARAAGGPVSAGSMYLVGEEGPELFVPRASGSIVPNGAGGVVVHQTINVQAGVAQTVRAEMLAMLPRFKRETIDAVADARQRGGRFAAAMGA